MDDTNRGALAPGAYQSRATAPAPEAPTGHAAHGIASAKGEGGDPDATNLRRRLLAWTESASVQTVITVLIIANALTLGLETVAALQPTLGPVLRAADAVFLGAFVVELVLRMAGYGRRFFRDPWNTFDFIVVAVSLLPAAGPLSVLRALRVLRVLRLISIAPTMRRVVTSLLSAIPGLASIIGIMSIIFYVGAVIATKLFGATFPEWFGSLGKSAYTLFQVMTLESWSMGIVRPLMERHPEAWLFFVPFILVATFTMLNLFIAVIVNAMQQGQVESRQSMAVAHEERGEILVEVVALRSELEQLRRALVEREGAIPSAPQAFYSDPRPQ